MSMHRNDNECIALIRNANRLPVIYFMNSAMMEKCIKLRPVNFKNPLQSVSNCLSIAFDYCNSRNCNIYTILIYKGSQQKTILHTCNGRGM